MKGFLRRQVTVLAFLLIAPAVFAQDTDADDEAAQAEIEWDDILQDDAEDDAFGDVEPDDAVNDPFADLDQADSTDDPFADLDALFQDDMVEVAEPPGDAVAPHEDLLTAEGVTWGGRISGRVQTEWGWDNVGTADFDILDAPNESLSPSVSSDLFFNARPDAQFRVFGKFKIASDSGGAADLTQAINDAALTGDLPEGWTREENEDGDTEIRDEEGDLVFTVAAEEEVDDEDPQTGTAPALNFEIYELFSDFNYKESIFFRFGKHTIRWGVGYFWSPTDVLNLSTIDVEDPTADREGPISLKTQLPFGIHNAYFFLITNIDAKPLEVAVAPKVDFVVGNTEFGVGGYYQMALSPRLALTFTSSLGDFDFFGEGLLSLGSDRTFVRRSRKQVTDFEEPPEDLQIVLDTYTVESIPFYSGTVGLRYFEELNFNAGNLVLIAQYYYNGEGYKDSSLLESAYFLLQNSAFNGLIIEDEAAQPEDYEDPPVLAAGDLFNWGKHYAAATVGWSNILDTKLGVSLFGLVNLSDLSGIASPSLSFELIDTFSVSAGARITFGDRGDEYTNTAALINGTTGEEATGSTMSFTLSVSMGGGGF